MSTMKEQHIHGYSTNFFQGNDIIKVATAYWSPGSDITLWIRVPYYFYAGFVHFSGLIYVFFTYAIFPTMLKDTVKLFSYLGMVLTLSIGVFKQFIFVFKQTTVDGIKAKLQDDEYKYESLNENGPSQMFNEEKKISSRRAFLIFGAYTLVPIFAFTSSVIRLNKDIPGETFEGTGKTCDDFMSYYFLIPFNSDTKHNCKYASAFMGLGIGIWAFLIGYYDGMFVSWLRCLKIQLAIIGHVLMTVRQRSLRKLKMSEDISILHDEEYPELEQEMFKQMVHVNEHLKLLIGVCDEIENLVTFITLGQTLSSIFVFASCLYVATIVPLNSPEFFAHLQYFFAIMIQIGLMCWTGNEITRAASKVSDSLYHSDWCSCSRRYKSSMLLTMSRLQRPLYLTIGKFTPLSITTLVNVCRGSFSYFTVFKSVK